MGTEIQIEGNASSLLINSIFSVKYMRSLAASERGVEV